MKKLIVRGPALSRSGYGEQTRFLMRALRAYEERFDIFLMVVGWGATGWIYEDNEERRWMDSLIAKTVEYINSGGQFDISVQVTIPNEWERLAPINIGYTAGIESTRIDAGWIAKSNEMDKIIVISNHAKYGFAETVYDNVHIPRPDNHDNRVDGFRCITPIEVVNYAVRNIEPKKIELELDCDFNYLVVAQWSVRKNLENTIKWFLKEFAYDEVGLVLKVNSRSNSPLDRPFTEEKLREPISIILKDYPDYKCKIYLLHGDMSENELTGLYSHPKIKALINLAHGEGFGLPMFEAAYNELPVVSPNWGGQNDFLYAPAKDKKKKKVYNKAHFAKVDFLIQPVQDEAVWGLGDKGAVLIKDSMWCFPHEGSYKKAIRDVYKNYGKYKKMARILKDHLVKNFTEEKQYKKFADAIYTEDTAEISDWLDSLDVKEFA